MLCRYSIIVPTRNRAALLDLCLTAIEELEFPKAQFEVFVVDDGSDPPPDGVIAKHAGLFPLRYLKGAGQGPARARNVALRAASGEFVVFTDDDCRPHRQWLNAFDEAMRQQPGVGFGGRIVDSPENGLCGRTSQMLVSFLYEYNEASGGLRFFCSNNLAFPRERLLALGGFDESFPLAAAEDRSLCARWLKHGGLAFVPAAVVEHRQQLDFTAFLRQQFRYGRGALQFWRRRQADDAIGNKLEPWHFYSRMLGYPFRKVPFATALGMSCLLALSQVAVALGYFTERLRNVPVAPSDESRGDGTR